ncbi:MAG: glutaredoxin 3 [Pseudomonadota bacterium]|nr:glutaredoxin 3 [Pseudomonadota bacterium]
MPKIEIYTSDFCPFCARAKNLLKKRGATFTEFNVDMNPALRVEMTERAQGRTSVPQIFFDGNLIGGSDDLAALEVSGELESLL